MANRRFEMFEYRQVLTRMRLGDTDRAIARVGLMGRRKVARLRRHRRGGGLARRRHALARRPRAWRASGFGAHTARGSPRWPNHIASGSRVGGVKVSRAPPSTAPWYAATASPVRTPRCAASSRASRPLTHKSPPSWSSTPARRRRSTSARVRRSSTRVPVSC